MEISEAVSAQRPARVEPRTYSEARGAEAEAESSHRLYSQGITDPQVCDCYRELCNKPAVSTIKTEGLPSTMNSTLCILKDTDPSFKYFLRFFSFLFIFSHREYSPEQALLMQYLI